MTYEEAYKILTEHTMNYVSMYDMEALEVAIKAVEKQIPAADVVEVRHGEWIPYEQPLGVGYSITNYKPTHCCSHCKGLGWEFYAICPHCGAKMGGKVQSLANKKYPRCSKCVYEMGCSRTYDNEGTCPKYKRDAPDGGYYG